MSESAKARWARFLELGGVVPVEGEGSALLDAIFASGEFLPELLLADVRGLGALAGDPYLRRPKPAEVIAAEVRTATAGARDFVDLQRRLRLVRRAEILRLGARELGWGTTEEVARELSAFADVCLDVAVAFCDAALTRELGPARADSGAPTSFVVMAMGKLGGQELNFSSDIDVCYFYSTDAGAAGATGQLTLHHYYAELSRRVTAAIEEPTADGMIFRVDLRLRPEGRSGPLCNALPAAERYYETFGRTWERQAWLRARPAAGDRALGDELLSALDAFIYPRSVEPRMVEEVRGLRALFRDPADASGALGDTGFDVKLGSGGIRDVEMVVQALQLLHAGKRADLRERNTPRALPRLVVAGLLGDREAQTLLDAYRFWRRLEHRVQVATGAQRHRLPATDEAREAFARGLGFADLAAFDAEVAATRAAVEAIAATLGEPPAEAHLAAARLLDPMRDREELERRVTAAGIPRRRGRGRHAGADRRAHAGGVPRGGDRLARSRSRAGAFSRPRAAGLGRPHGALARSPAARSHVGDAVRDQRSARRAPGAPPGDVGAVPRRAGGAGPLDGGALRASGEADRRRERGRQGRGDGAARHPVASRRRSSCASACTTWPAACRRWRSPRSSAIWRKRACRRGSRRRCPPSRRASASRGTALTVLGLGSLGAREMRYGSDLDLVFLYGAGGESDAGVDHREWFARASQRFIATMEAMLEEGRLYQVDTRLRPSGEQGLLVTSWASFERYHREESAAWERVALLRARIVWTDEPAAARDERARALTSLAFDLPVDDDSFRADLRRVRGRVERERGKVPDGSRHLQFDPGGIMDVELLVALGQLRHAADPEVRTTSTDAVLERLVALGWPSVLRDDYAVLRRTALRLRLLLDRPQAVVSPRDLPALARSLGTTATLLAAELDERMARVRAVFAKYF